MKLYSFLEILLTSVQWASLLVAIFFWHKYKNTPQRFLLPYLIFAIGLDTIGIYVFPELGISSYGLYNIFPIVTYAVLCWWFLKLLPNYKKLIVFSFAIFMLVNIYYAFSGTFTEETWVISLLFASAGYLVIATLYFSEILKSTITIKIRTHHPMWIITGFLFFFLGIVPILYFQRVVSTFSNGYNFVLLIINILLYGCLILGFLNLKKSE